MPSKSTKTTEENQGLSSELREALARREEARAQLRLAESELAKQRAEIARAKAEIFRADTSSQLRVAEVMRW